jgi:hypothetical protein
MNGALPPSSSESFLTVLAHCCISNLPISVYGPVIHVGRANPGNANRLLLWSSTSVPSLK